MESVHVIQVRVISTYAIILLLFKISFFDTTAKYAMLMNIYTALTPNIAIGAARLIVRTGSLISESA